MSTWSTEELLKISEDLLKESKNQERGIVNVLRKYDFVKVETFERRLLKGIFAIDETAIRSTIINNVTEAGNIPVIVDCNLVISHKCEKERYMYHSCLASEDKKKLERRYEICMKLISESSFFQEKIERIKQENENIVSLKGFKPKRHRGTRRLRMYD